MADPSELTGPQLFGPTFEEMRSPHRLSEAVREAARLARADDPLDPINLYNLHWEDDLGDVLAVLMPTQLTGVATPIAVLAGSKFPTGVMKTGPAYATLVEKQAFDEIVPGRDRLLIPSPGAFGLAAAWVATRMGYETKVLVPGEQPRGRLDAIRGFGAEVEVVSDRASGVAAVRAATRDDLASGWVLIDPFAEFGGYRFHAHVTAHAIERLATQLEAQGVGRGKPSALVAPLGTGATLGAGDPLKARHGTLIVGVEPLESSTLYDCGWGRHRISDTGTELVSWIHNVGNMDAITCVSDLDCVRGLSLIQEGEPWLVADFGIREDVASRLTGLFGVSGVAALLGAIKTVKHFGLGAGDLVVTVAPDGPEGYRPVLDTLAEHEGAQDHDLALRRIDIFHRMSTDFVLEGRHAQRRWHNQKHAPWVLEAGKSVEALEMQKSPDFWVEQQARVDEIDRRILQLRARLA